MEKIDTKIICMWKNWDKNKHNWGVELVLPRIGCGRAVAPHPIFWWTDPLLSFHDSTPAGFMRSVPVPVADLGQKVGMNWSRRTDFTSEIRARTYSAPFSKLNSYQWNFLRSCNGRGTLHDPPPPLTDLLTLFWSKTRQNWTETNSLWTNLVQNREYDIIYIE